MNAQFEISETCVVKVGNSLTVDYKVGEYVALDIIEGPPPVEGAKDERKPTSVFLRRPVARMLANALLAAAAEVN